jgi:phenylacetate-CoA ligase
MSSYVTGPCPCGRTSSRLTGIVGRTGDAVKVRGMFVVAKQAEQAIMSFGQVSGFQLVLGRRQHRDEMILKLELKDVGVDKAKLANDLNQRFQDTCRLKIDRIEFVERGAIPEEQQGIVDERTWD